MGDTVVLVPDDEAVATLGQVPASRPPEQLAAFARGDDPPDPVVDGY